MNKASGDDDSSTKLLDPSEDNSVDRTEGQLIQNHRQKDSNGARDEHSKQRADT